MSQHSWKCVKCGELKQHGDESTDDQAICKSCAVFECPKCFSPLEQVNCYWEHYQKIDIADAMVVDQETIFDELTDVECPKCSASILDYVHDHEELYDLIQDAT